MLHNARNEVWLIYKHENNVKYLVVDALFPYKIYHGVTYPQLIWGDYVHPSSEC